MAVRAGGGRLREAGRWWAQFLRRGGCEPSRSDLRQSGLLPVGTRWTALVTSHQMRNLAFVRAVCTWERRDDDDVRRRLGANAGLAR